MNSGNTCIQTRDTAADDRSVQGSLQPKRNTVKGRLCNSHQTGHACGKSNLLQLLILRTEANHKGSGSLRDVGSQHTGPKNGAVTQSRVLNRLNRREAVVHTRHDEERAERTHQERNYPSRIIIQPVEADGDHLTHQISKRAGNGDSQNARHDDGDHGRKENLDRLGGILVGKFLNIGLYPHDQQNRNHAAAVGNHGHRDEAEQTYRISGIQAGEAGMQQNACQHRRYVRAALEPLRCGNRQNERQEVEQRVAERIENLVGLRSGIHQMQRHQKRQQRLDHTGACQSGDHRLENSGQRAEEHRHNSLFLFLVIIRRSHVVSKISKLLDLVADISHIRSDYHLELAVLGHNALNALYLFNAFHVRLFRIIQTETQTGHTICNA